MYEIFVFDELYILTFECYFWNKKIGFYVSNNITWSVSFSNKNKMCELIQLGSLQED